MVQISMETSGLAGKSNARCFHGPALSPSFFAVLGGGEVCFGRYSVLFW